MADVNTDDQNVEAKYIFRRKGGRSIIDRKPIFSLDGESVLVIVEGIVRVYSIHTGNCIRILEPETEETNLISVHFPISEQHNLYGCSESGRVIIWTWEKGAVLREKKLELPANTKILTFDLLDNSECFVTGTKTSSIYYATYSLKTGGLVYDYKGTKIKYYGIISSAVGWCNGDRFAAICNGSKFLYIQNLVQQHQKTVIQNSNDIRILSVAAHSEESIVVITDALGRATILRGNLYKPNSLAREVMHWHFMPLIAATFSLQGSYLLTGGLENVLVKWSVGNLSTRAHEKQFIPRLPGSIRFIATSASHIAITLTNNSVVLASAQMRVVGTVLECGGLSAAARALGSALTLLRPRAALLLGGRTGHLQLYSTVTNQVIYNIDVTQQNIIPPSRSNLIPLNTEVTCATVSPDGSCLVTSEYRNDGVTYTEEKLKFWAASAKAASPFVLNTCVNLSHGGCKVVSIATNRPGNFCISAGGDRKFRIWKKETKKDARKKRIFWSCLTACYYSSGVGVSLAHNLHDKFNSGDFEMAQSNCYPYMIENKKPDIVQRLMNMRQENDLVKESEVNAGVMKDDNYDMGGVAVSQDGSLIAAWFGCKLTLWDSHLCSMKTALSHIALRPKGVDVRFGNNDAAHYIVCTTDSCVAVWSLLSLSIKWIVKLEPSCITCDPFSNKMAIVTTSNDVIVFNPRSSTPVLNMKNLVSPKSGVLKYCTFGIANGDDIRLYMMRNDSEIYCLEPKDAAQGSLEVISQSNLPKSNFSALVADQQTSGIIAPQTNYGPVGVHVAGSAAIAQFFSGSAHMMPPVGLLCSPFLEQLSGKQELVEEDVEEPNAMDMDPASSDEDEPFRDHSPKQTELWTANYEEVKEKGLRRIMKQSLIDNNIAVKLFVK